MRFTQEHVAVLEKHKEHWNTLKTLQFMKNLDGPVIDELQKVHNEAIGVHWFSKWCSACVADMVRILYTRYEAETETPEAPLVQPPAAPANRKQRRHAQQQQPVSGQQD